MLYVGRPSAARNKAERPRGCWEFHRATTPLRVPSIQTSNPGAFALELNWALSFFAFIVECVLLIVQHVQKRMAKSPVIQMQNWFMSNQHQWWCGPVGLNSSTQSDWFQYTEALQDATGRLRANLICACSLKNILCDPEKNVEWK